MPPVVDAHVQLTAGWQRLLKAPPQDPGSGPLPRGIGRIKIVGSEPLVLQPRVHTQLPPTYCKATIDEEPIDIEIRLLPKSSGPILPRGKRERTPRSAPTVAQRPLRAQSHRATVVQRTPPPGTQLKMPGRLSTGHQIDDSPEGIRAVDRRPRPVHHFDPLQVFRSERQIEIVVARLRVVDAHPVHQEKHLTEGGSAHLQIGLHPGGTATARVQTGQGGEKLDDAGGPPLGDGRAVEQHRPAPQCRKLPGNPRGAYVHGW